MVIGPVHKSSSGMEGIGWPAVSGYCQHTGMELDGWESEQVVKLSAIYAQSVASFDNANEPPPYQTQERKEKVLSAMTDHLRGAKVSGRRSAITNRGR